ncbi:MAG TPA: S1C family serine protease [Pirellulaceae bacterium]|nr:S1C family serine protease [Pirellulaceae bacterium]
MVDVMRRFFPKAICLAAVFSLAFWLNVAAQETPDPGEWIKPARQLHASMVTLRVSCKEEAKAGPADAAAPGGTSSKPQPADEGGDGVREKSKQTVSEADKNCRRPCSVVVCSGVCVAPNRVVTAVTVSSDSKIRLTFPGGKQDDAHLRVVDEFSGLVLLDSPNCPAKPLELTSELPEEGSTVMTAAAWGVEKPLVFQGMVSGTGHMLSGMCYPPLLVCQLPTTSTSTGSAIVNREGKLVGVVVGSDPAARHQGWMTYAVPASHVQRLLRACEAVDKEGHERSVVVLKRRRPKVGWVLESDGETIKVERILSEGPAEKAGIKKGDLVLKAEGVQIRSIYQAHSHTMCKQAGDTLTYSIQRGDQILDLVVVLGGAVEVESLPADKLPEFVQPKLEFGRDERGLYYVKPYRATEAGAKSPDSEKTRLEQLERENQALRALLKELPNIPQKSP